MTEKQNAFKTAARALHGLKSLCFCLVTLLVFANLAPAATAQSRVALPALASSSQRKMLVPVGRAVGIKLFSEGVMVVGISDLAGAPAPAQNCGLREGDIITHINNVPVNSIEAVREVLQGLKGEKMTLRATRGTKKIQLTTQAQQCSDGSYKLGAWIRDSMAGIGTMTFYDPDTGLFGALGHGINDVDTAQLMPLATGAIMFASVCDVKKGSVGAPGELRGTFKTDEDLGVLFANTDGGIFGTLSDAGLVAGLKPVQVAQANEVKVGPATILSNLSGTDVAAYDILITKVRAGGDDTRDLSIKVTDVRLLAATGGIVQGMSGSPIMQNGRLVGAVTHVLVNDPTEGYGILAQTMLARAGEPQNAAAA